MPGTDMAHGAIRAPVAQKRVEDSEEVEPPTYFVLGYRTTSQLPYYITATRCQCSYEMPGDAVQLPTERPSSYLRTPGTTDLYDATRVAITLRAAAARRFKRRYGRYCTGTVIAYGPSVMSVQVSGTDLEYGATSFSLRSVSKAIKVPMILCAQYVESGTNTGYAATVLLAASSTDTGYAATRSRRRAGGQAMLLQLSYGVLGTEIGYAATVSYAMSGFEIAYAATRVREPTRRRP
eukprot:2820553-Rhodomonas_salina.4